MQPVQDLTIEGTVSKTQYQFILQDAEPVRARRLDAQTGRQAEATSAARRCRQRHLRSGAFDLRRNRSRPGRSFRHYAGDRSITRSTTPTASGSSPPSSPIRTSTASSSRPIRALQTSLQSLSDIYLPSSVGSTPVPLAALAKFREETAPLQVTHLGQFPAATISFNLAPGASLGEAVTAIKQAQADLGLPPSVITSFQGAALAFQSSLSNRALPDFGGDRHRLHRAGRAL